MVPTCVLDQVHKSAVMSSSRPCEEASPKSKPSTQSPTVNPLDAIGLRMPSLTSLSGG